MEVMEYAWPAGKVLYGLVALLTWGAFIGRAAHKVISKQINEASSCRRSYTWDDVGPRIIGGIFASAIWPVTFFIGGCIGCAYLFNKHQKQNQPGKVL